jgi:hypothetical protein
MKTLLAITDLTRMQHGHICIAGQDSEGRCIRPVLPPPGIPETLALANDQAIIFPFAAVELDIKQHTPKPPHTEDHLFDAHSVIFKGTLKEEQKRRVVEKSRFPSVAAIFDQPIAHDTGFHVADGQGPRSVGTVRPKAFHKIFYSPGDDDAWNYRLGFYDEADEYYRLKITDLTWNYYCAAQRADAHGPTEIAEEFSQRLKGQLVYLRIGLSRGWKKFPGRCFLQINGLYTFPDYLKGKTFADFRRTNG